MSFTYPLPSPPPRKRTPKEIAQSEAFLSVLTEAAEIYNLQRQPSVVDAPHEVANEDLSEFWGHVEAGLINTPWMLDTNEVLRAGGGVRLLTERE